MSTVTYIGASISNFKSIKIAPGPNALIAETPVSIGLGQYRLTQEGWDAAAIATAWNTSSNPFFQQITAAAVSAEADSALLLTHNILGQDFEITCTINGTTAQVSSIQHLTVVASAGTFTLSDGTVTSGAITYSSNSATLQTNIQNAIYSMSGYGAGDVTVTYDNGVFVLDFSTGRFAGLAVDTWTAVSSLTGGTAAATIARNQAGNVGTNEISTVTFPADGTHTESLNTIQTLTPTGSPTSGSFTLVVPTVGTTEAIPFTAGRSTVKRILEDLVGQGNTIVHGGPLATEQVGTPVEVTGALTNDAEVGFNGSTVMTNSNPTGLVAKFDSTLADCKYVFLRYTLNVAQGTTLVNAHLNLVLTDDVVQTVNKPLAYCAAYSTDSPAWPADWTAANATLSSISPVDERSSHHVNGLTGELFAFPILETIQGRINQPDWTSGDSILLVFQAPTGGAGGDETYLVPFESIESGTPPALVISASTGSSYSYLPVTVEFAGDYAGQAIAAMTPSGIVTVALTQAGGSQTVENIVGGTWSLVIPDHFTVPNIPYDVSASALEALIEAEGGAGCATVTGGPAPGTALVISFQESLQKKSMRCMTTGFSSLKPGIP